MAKILSVETSPYYEKQIEIYAKNKVGQFSKYLEKNPTFVEYYHINQVLSRADVGSQSVKEEIGRKSPIRYNKIKEFPIYGLPELKPELTYDEDGMDMDLDLNGLVVLPGTIHPIPGDYFYFKFPGMSVGILWRVTSKEFNTVQANDYYLLDAEIYATAKETDKNSSYSQLQKQVVEDYTCIYENIGTKDAIIQTTNDANRNLTVRRNYDRAKNDCTNDIAKDEVKNLHCDSTFTDTDGIDKPEIDKYRYATASEVGTYMNTKMYRSVSTIIKNFLALAKN